MLDIPRAVPVYYGQSPMKTPLFLLGFVLAAAVSSVWAAPTIEPKDISSDALKDIATERQKASFDQHDKAKAKAEKEREDAIKEAKEQTAKNDAGLKKTIVKRHLNSMLPPCEREPEAPREPGDYNVRY